MSPANQISSQGALHDQQAQPFSEFAPCFRQQTYLLKSERPMQRDAGDILSTDASNHGVTAFQVAVEDQLRQEHGADPVASAIGAHINGVFDSETISIAGAEL